MLDLSFVFRKKLNKSMISANEILKKKGKTFYWASFMLSTKHAERAVNLYALCRHIDDLADEAENKDLAFTALESLKYDLSVGSSKQKLIQNGIKLLNENDIQLAVLAELVNGVSSDLRHENFQNLSDLLRYSYQVAGTVGLMMAKLLDTHSQIAARHAVDLGVAMQLTNICRDVAADANLARCYLPASMTGSIDYNSLLQPTALQQVPLISCIETILLIADRYYDSGEQGIAYLPMRARFSILIAARLYRQIGWKLKANKCNYWRERTVISNIDKVQIIIKNLIKIPFSRCFWTPNKKHDTNLHLEFQDFATLK